MSDEHDIEHRLRGYRPIAPPADLRRRVSGPAASPPWRCVAAAAVLMASIASVQAASNRTVARLASAPEASSILDDLTASLGGDERARLIASTVVVNQRIDAEMARRDGGAPAVTQVMP